MSCLGLGIVVVGTLALAGSLAHDPAPDDPVASRSVRDLVYVSSSTTTTAEPGRSGWLGISAVEQKGRDGVTVTACDLGSPAADRLRPDDLIVSVDNIPTPRMAQLITVLAASAPGHTARIEIHRGGRALVLSIVLGRQP
jgi:S1-C subfamily serine protease